MIVLCVDIDVLLILEKNEVLYCFINFGVMYVCGYDVYLVSLLGVVKILWMQCVYFVGIIKLIFQFGEEKVFGGVSIMIKDGVLKNLVFSVIFGQYVYLLFEAGKIGICFGLYMVLVDELYLMVKGWGGYGVLFYDMVDSIVLIVQIIIVL